MIRTLATQTLWPGLLLAVLTLPAEAQRDGMEERVAACAACHGAQGRSAAEAYAPSIAGKPAGYLHEQLRNFRDGRRQNRVMQPMLAYLSDDYLGEMAAYYAAQAPARRVAARGTGEQALAAGRALVERGDAARELPACQDCHGAELLGFDPAIPGLLALSPDYLGAQLGAWRGGTRSAATPDCMAKVAQLLTPEEIAAVTAWIASRPSPETYRPSAGTAPALPIPCGAVP